MEFKPEDGNEKSGNWVDFNLEFDGVAPNPDQAENTEENDADSPANELGNTPTDESPLETVSADNLEASQQEHETLDPDEVLIRVNAIQGRKKLEDEISATFGIETSSPGENFERIFDISQTALLIKRVESPEEPIDEKEVVDLMLKSLSSEEAIEAIIEDQGMSRAEAEEGLKWLSQNMKPLFEGIAKSVTGDGGGFKREFEATERVAQEHGVSFADVYKVSALYRQSVRERYDNDINNYAEALIGPLQGSLNAVVDFAKSQGIEADDLRVTETLEYSRGLYRDGVTMSFIRYWGSEQIKDLSPSSKADLGITSREAIVDPKLIGDVSQESTMVDSIDVAMLRTAFGRNYFRENSWDVNQPTAGQIQMMRQQPAWQNPLGLIRDR